MVNIRISLLSAAVIVTGCLNSVFTKYQDNQCVRNCQDPDISKHIYFEQPALQTLQMFVGESGCWLVVFLSWISTVLKYYSKGKKIPLYAPLSEGDSDQTKLPELTGLRSLILAIPAICDVCGTTMLNVGLLYTPVSIYQMARGSLILFVALFSVFFLNRRISRLEWLSLFVVTFGVFLVGLSGALGNKVHISGDKNTSFAVIFGITLILIAEIFAATQFVSEEYIISRSSIDPLRLVGFEGIFGGSITLLAMVIAYIVVGRSNSGGPFDIVTSFKDVTANSQVIWSSVAIMISIGSFNFFGISVTDELSATARSTIDTCRTLLVWLLSLYLGWESFKWLQLVGFSLLVLGTLTFNGVLKAEKWYFIPEWFKKDAPLPGERVIDVVDEQIERF
ncbi:BA75_04497T0 [Komagataella pastoris]|uniref:BA75_04497T0 n=1 Tax=Komagataella pastoris TaxID=4922 RepID=A0A1B2JI56_PICPA|nr:BA75_04497T0 [Komagataella pastoris]